MWILFSLLTAITVLIIIGGIHKVEEGYVGVYFDRGQL